MVFELTTVLLSKLYETDAKFSSPGIRVDLDCQSVGIMACRHGSPLMSIVIVSVSDRKASKAIALNERDADRAAHPPPST
jgi:hypothetical protein